MNDEAPQADLKPDFKGCISKKILKELPEGMLLQSNVAIDPLSPIFEETLGPKDKDTREAVWKRMKKLRVDRRMFRGYMTTESYDHEFTERLKCLRPSDFKK
ncbi:MAG: hypothetical protein ACLP00_01590 [Terracidiphilus sp.]